MCRATEFALEHFVHSHWVSFLLYSINRHNDPSNKRVSLHWCLQQAQARTVYSLKEEKKSTKTAANFSANLIVTCWFCQTSSGSPANPIYTVRGDSSAGIEINLHIKVVFTNTKCVRRALVLLFAMQQVQHTCGFWKSGMLFSLTWKTIQMNKLYKMNHSENNFHSKIASKFHNN